ncbi:MarR family winged helix-turn-helix transcriptional regulator [Shimia sagamensis]|nr:MarR family winged helix-turn-helix transcriptional regulator [Shimia sagamensis]
MEKTDSLYRLVWMSRPLMQVAELAVEQGLEGSGLTVRMRAVLETLREQGALPVPEIARHLEIQRQYVQVMVNETLAEGLTEQRANPRHKRSPLLSLTAKGQAMIDEAVLRERQLLEAIGDEFGDREVETALDVVMRLTACLKGKTGVEL